MSPSRMQKILSNYLKQKDLGVIRTVCKKILHYQLYPVNQKLIYNREIVPFDTGA